MRTLDIDVETYSSVDIGKCGVYKYCESDDFEILLFGYSADGGEVRVVDLAQGEKIPEEVLEAIEDEGVLKYAHNASFERIVLSRYLGLDGYLSPASWRCTMVWGAYLGLPLSLAGVGVVLGLEKRKMEEGKNLIRYFCAPTRTRDGMKRNMPWDAPEKWEMFKAYNKRDVEVEMQIGEKLVKFPVPDFIWEEYCIDQEINDRGIMVDMKLVDAAIRMDAEIKAELKEKVRRITELENPNSVQQMRQWLADNGVKADSLDKKAVKGLLETDCSDEVKDVLRMRQQLAKSSVKKYQAMLNSACEDGRAHGMFMFYGANRTGRWCLTGDHEVLTDNGWCRLDEWHGGRIACWNSSSEAVSFQPAQQLEFEYDGPMYTYKDGRIDQCSTPDHKMRAQRRYGGEWSDMTVEEMSHCRPCIPMNGYRYHRGCANPIWLRVLIMTQADGFYTMDGSIRYNFKKLRKIERCKSLLRKAEIPFVVHENKGVVSINVPARVVPLWLREFRSKTFGYWLLDENPDIFFDELPNWDGYYPAPNSIQYTTCNKQNADIAQALAHMSGRCANIRYKKASNEKWSDAYVVDIWLAPKNCHEIRNKPVIAQYKGKVYCAATQTGYFLVRRNGKVWITGNSGRIIQLQNLPQNHLPDLKEARTLVRLGNLEAVKMLYEDVPDTLSQLIRTAFVPRPGFLFYVADFSAIEARVLSWLAGEQWRMDVFKENGDIYCATASRMFGVPVVKHGQNAELRQKGKQAELACIAEGSLVLTDRGEVPIEDVRLEDKLWDGEEWVSHEGVVYRGEREVIQYEGLTATPDHLVWIEGQPRPIHFGFAAANGLHLMQTGDGRQAVRLGKDHITGETVERNMESVLCPDPVYRVRSGAMAASRESHKRFIERLSKLFSAKTDTTVVRSQADSSKAEVREPKRYWIPQLWRAGNPLCISECNGGGAVSDSEVRTSRQGTGDRPNRHERRLRTGEPTVCGSQDKLCEPAAECAIPLRSGVLAIQPECSGEKVISRGESGRDYTGCGKSCNREKKELEINRRTARLYDIQNAGRHHRFTVSGKLVHNCGYGGSVGALKAFNAPGTDEELKELVEQWRSANSRIVELWREVDRVVKRVVKKKTTEATHGITFSYQSGFLFVTLPSGRKLAYVKPRMGTNRFDGESVTYEGVGENKKWERIETFGGKLVENLIQAISRDLLMHAIKKLRGFRIVAHVHDEIIIEAPEGTSLDGICTAMAETPPWAEGLVLDADGFVTEFYKKE